MKGVLAILMLWPMALWGQTLEVHPGELALEVRIQDTGHVPLAGEQVLITIRGVYRRHITLESLVQPDFEGFNWAQLGSDYWSEERIDGQKVKVFTRRMALYPDRAGTLEIGAFTHKLTLTDEGDDWFEHEIHSQPVSVTVDAAPTGEDWWFPVQSLRISDDWSNAPDQLKPGEGVLRVIRLEAHGATPDMIPPMPDLASPSALIFPHPEKRLVELTPSGPVTYAFWRWTIRPSNDVSTIVEPITLRYFDTTHRVAREAVISPQRVAYGDVVPMAAARDTEALAPSPARLPGPAALVAALAVFLILLVMGLRGKAFPTAGILHNPILDPLAYRLRRAAAENDAKRVRSLARKATTPGDAAFDKRGPLLGELDRNLYDPRSNPLNLRDFARRFLAAR